MPGSATFHGGLVTLALYTAFATLLATCTSPLALRHRLRWPATLLIIGPLSLCSLNHFVALFTYLDTQLYPALEGWILLLDNASQVFRLVLSQYFYLFAALLAGHALFIAGTARLMLRQRATCGTSLLVGGVVVVGTVLLPILLGEDVQTETAETVLLKSLLKRPEAPSIPALHLAKSGPPLRSGKHWLSRARSSRGPRPNVLLIVLESVPAGHLHHEGYARDVSPHLDAIAKGAVRFSRVWSSSTHSNYAQMAILSSLFPRRGSTLDVYQTLSYPRTLPHDIFVQLGYASATFSSQNEHWGGMRRFQKTRTRYTFVDSNTYPGRRMNVKRAGEEKLPDSLTVKLASDWIRGQKDPWFVYLNLQRTHFPYTLPENAEPVYLPAKPHWPSFRFMHYPREDLIPAKNRYDNALRYVDQQIGELHQTLQRVDQLDQTLWIIVSDHGEAFYDHGMVTHGKSLWEAESRTPLLFYWPGELEPQLVEEPTSHLDIMPTTLHLLTLPPHPSYQGRPVRVRDALQNTRKRSSIIPLTMQGLVHADAVVCWPWKYIQDHSRQQTQLYHLARDPAETRNQANARPVVASSMHRALQTFVEAQLEYHQSTSSLPERRFAPRLPRCPF